MLVCPLDIEIIIMALKKILDDTSAKLEERTSTAEQSGKSGVNLDPVFDEVQAWLKDPANRDSPFYSEIATFAKQRYTGVEETPLDGFFGLFGPTEHEKALATWKDKRKSDWQSLLGRVSEYQTNLPSNLSALSKQAGYNTDLTGETTPLDTFTPQDSPSLDYNSLPGGKEKFETISSFLKDTFMTAVSLATVGVDLGGKMLSNNNLRAQNDALELQLGTSADSWAKTRALTHLNGLSFLTPSANGVIDVDKMITPNDIKDYVEGSVTARNKLKAHLISQFEDNLVSDYEFGQLSARNKSRLKASYRTYVNSPSFEKDVFDMYHARENAFQDVGKLRSQVGFQDSSSGIVGLKSMEEIYKPFYELAMQASKGEFMMKKAGEYVFNEKKFNDEMQATTRKMMRSLNESANNGDVFAKTLLFTMCTDPRYFQTIGNIASGVGNFLGNMMPWKGIQSMLFNLISPKAPKI